MERRRGCVTFKRVYFRSILNNIEISLNIDSSKSKKGFDNDEIETLMKIKECIDSSKNIDKSDVMSSEKNSVDEIISRDKNFESSPFFDIASYSEDLNEYLLAYSDDDEIPLNLYY